MKVIQKYTLTLNFLKKYKSWTFQKHIDLQSQADYDDKKNSKKNLHTLEDGASGVQVGDIKQVTCQNNCLKYNKITSN